MWEGRRQTILFKFAFTTEDFPLCVSMALIPIYISLSSFLHLWGFGVVSEAAAAPFHALLSLYRSGS